MKNHNWRYLSGMKSMTDLSYQIAMAKEGVEIPDEDLYTPNINKHYIDKDERNAKYVKKLLAMHGLLMETNNE